jgi:hypothetical protein
MKIRKGFVSNSSSSSFIVVDGSGDHEKISLHETFETTLGDLGENEFGWQEKEYHGFYNKVNWAYLQAGHQNSVTKWMWIDMLETVIKKETGAKEIVWDEELKRGYIDHLSIGGENASMFESEEAMRTFLFNTASYIQNDNDNH